VRRIEKMNVRELTDKIIAETDRIWLHEPDEVKRLRLGLIESGAGIDNQCFTTMVFVDGELRDLGAYIFWSLINVAEDQIFSLDHCKKLYRVIVPVGAGFLGFCGFEKLRAFHTEMEKTVDRLETKEEFREIVAALYTYVNRLHYWVHHMFPWHLGYSYPQRKPEDLQDMLKLMNKSHKD
jgi:hypothetical protein